jgi:hypothetical protein
LVCVLSQVHFGRFLNKDGASRSVSAQMPSEKVKESCNAAGAAADVFLDRQLQAWRNNPSWAGEPPEIKVLNSNCFPWMVSLLGEKAQFDRTFIYCVSSIRLAVGFHIILKVCSFFLGISSAKLCMTKYFLRCSDI